ncbi:hypothetical protein [Longibacter salinarum]|uniref:hypothetical protein n=1 Tax=Longibacter salinarum TaxID=1850348 RepID=UPI00118105AB|nr:hypothetical protein [Longibacter salinarum]
MSPELVGRSSFQLAPDSVDAWDYRIISESYHYYAKREGDLVFRKQVDQAWTRGLASPKSKLTVEAFTPSNLEAPRWTLRDSADTGAVWDSDYYRTVKRGCCSGETTTAIYDLETGDHVITADAGILQIERDSYFDQEQEVVVPRQTWLVGYRSMQGMLSAPVIVERDSVFGVLQMADAQDNLSRVLLRSGSMTAEETYSSREYAAFSPTIELVRQFSPESAHGVRTHGENATVETNGRALVSIRLPEMNVVIPIQDGKLTDRGATSPDEIELELQVDSVPPPKVPSSEGGLSPHDSPER